jgi:DNA-binding transcriptional MerR regulator
VALYDDEHLSTLERVRSLQAKGFTLATIARILSGELDAADQALVGALTGEVLQNSPGDLVELDELAERSGVPAGILRAVEQVGLLVPRQVGDREGYTEDDVAVARAGLVLLEWGLPLTELLDLARKHDEAMRDVAERAVKMFDSYVRTPRRSGTGALTENETEEEKDVRAQKLVAAFEALMPATATLVTHHFTRVLLAVAMDHIEHVGSPTELLAVNASSGSKVGA